MQFFKRTLECGNVSEELVGKEVCVNGWVNSRRDHGGVIFIDLRDRSGILQLVFNPENLNDMINEAHKLRLEYVVSAKGILEKRVPEMVNPKMPTGEYEIKITEFSILSSSKALPFQLDDAEKVSEDIRLKYRYLDLRRPRLQNMFKLRHEVVLEIRNHLAEHGFLEIETPLLSKSTPEGARDFLVPSRMEEGHFYALPQSPQIYKQLLMVAGMERYFQIARCFRDEDLSADRQPEFTQLDMEMSFVDEEDVFNICESMMQKLLKKFLGTELTFPLKRYSYAEIFDQYGSDKPDMRFDLKINDITTAFESTTLTFLKSTIDKGGKLGALCVKDKKFSRSELDGWVNKVTKEYGAKGMIYVRFNEDKSHSGSISKYLPDNFFDLAQACVPGLTTNDTLFIIAGDYNTAWSLLGKLRVELGQTLELIDTSKQSMFWVTDFPMFEWDEETKRWYSVHHPFTAPTQGWENVEPKDMKARGYDLIWNGYELGGGSIRIHDATMQEKIFEILGISKEEAREKFGFLLDAQQFGYPPEGGIAFGVDRIIMILANTPSIRDVVAFPKTQKGSCLMMETPSTVDDEQLKELNLKVIKS